MNVMGNKILGVSNMVVCDVCKKNKAIRKITYPTMVPMENVTQLHGRTVNGCKRNNVEYDNICQQCRDIIDYVFRLTMIYNKVNESEGNEE